MRSANKWIYVQAAAAAAVVQAAAKRQRRLIVLIEWSRFAHWLAAIDDSRRARARTLAQVLSGACNNSGGALEALADAAVIVVVIVVASAWNPSCSLGRRSIGSHNGL